MGIEMRGAAELAEKFQTVRKRYPEEVKKELKKLGRDFKKKVIEKTPDGKSTNTKWKLKNNYHLGTVKETRSSIYEEFYSSSPHFHLVERGHRITNKDGKELGFAPGVHMVERSSDEYDAETPAELDGWMSKMISRYGL